MGGSWQWGVGREWVEVAAVEWKRRKVRALRRAPRERCGDVAGIGKENIRWVGDEARELVAGLRSSVSREAGWGRVL